MTERSMGSRMSWFVAEVENVKDPDQAGRVQLRVKGKHDDTSEVKSEHLPWGLPVQDVTSAAMGKIGKTPLGLMKGSQIIGFWADDDHQIPVILGSIGKSGDPKSSQTTVDGTEEIDIDKGSIPTAATNQSAPVERNPYSKLNESRITINDVNLGNTDIRSVSRDSGIINKIEVDKKLAEPKKPTTASAKKTDKSDVLDIIKQVDPSNVSAVLKNLVDSFSSVRMTIDLTSPEGLVNTLSSALTGALSAAAKQIGMNDVLGMAVKLLDTDLLSDSTRKALSYAMSDIADSLNSSGVLPLAEDVISDVLLTATSITAKPPISSIVDSAGATFVRQFYSLENEKYPGYLEWIDTETSKLYYTLRGDLPHYASALAEIAGENARELVSSLVANVGSLENIARSIETTAQNIAADGIKAVLGAGADLQNMLEMAENLIPDIASSVKEMVSGHLPQSVLNTEAVSEAMNKFIKNQGLLKKMRTDMTKALEKDVKELEKAVDDIRQRLKV